MNWQKRIQYLEKEYNLPKKISSEINASKPVRLFYFTDFASAIINFCEKQKVKYPSKSIANPL